MELLIGILIFILVMVLINVVSLNVKLDLNKKIPNNNQVDLQDPKQHPAFREGVNHAFALVQVVLYKMWKDNDILDFDNLNMDIKSNLSEITSDINKLNKWNSEFLEYMKNKEKPNDN